MKLKTATAALMIAAFVVPAFAADEFYVVQDVKTKKCEIVEQKPVAKEMTVVGGDGVVYHTRTEAETAMKTVKVCHTE
jgi:hypothetical protein